MQNTLKSVICGNVNRNLVLAHLLSVALPFCSATFSFSVRWYDVIVINEVLMAQLWCNHLDHFFSSLVGWDSLERIRIIILMTDQGSYPRKWNELTLIAYFEAIDRQSVVTDHHIITIYAPKTVFSSSLHIGFTKLRCNKLSIHNIECSFQYDLGFVCVRECMSADTVTIRTKRTNSWWG